MGAKLYSRAKNTQSRRATDMPWTRKQVRYLLSSVSPLTAAQKAKMIRELKANPALGRKAESKGKSKKKSTKKSKRK